MAISCAPTAVWLNRSRRAVASIRRCRRRDDHREQGRLDVVMQNARHLVVGPSEAFTPEEMVKVFDTNLFGAQRVNRAVLPYLVSRKRA